MCPQAGQLAWPKWPRDAFRGHSLLCPSDPGVSLDPALPLLGITLTLSFFLCENSRDGLANPEGLSSWPGVINSVPFGSGEGWGHHPQAQILPPALIFTYLCTQLAGTPPQLGPCWDPQVETDPHPTPPSGLMKEWSLPLCYCSSGRFQCQ